MNQKEVNRRNVVNLLLCALFTAFSKRLTRVHLPEEQSQNDGDDDVPFET